MQISTVFLYANKEHAVAKVKKKKFIISPEQMNKTYE